MIGSIQKWFHKKGLLGAIAKNAMDQYFKWKLRDNTLPEAVIAKNIFSLRYSNPNGIFNNKAKGKIIKYLSSSFLPDSILEFCLISLDIEGNINPMDGQVYNDTAILLREFLSDFGYKVFDGRAITDFHKKWYDKIKD